MKTYEWRVTQRWLNGEELILAMDDKQTALDRQSVLDANTSHPSGFERRVEVVRIERREVRPWEIWSESLYELERGDTFRGPDDVA